MNNISNTLFLYYLVFMHIIFIVILFIFILFVYLLIVHSNLYRTIYHYDNTIRESINLFLFDERKKLLTQQHQSIYTEIDNENRYTLLKDLNTKTIKPFNTTTPKYIVRLMIFLFIIANTIATYFYLGKSTEWQNKISIEEQKRIPSLSQIEQLIQVIKKEPDNYHAIYTLGHLYLINQQYQQAITQFNILLEKKQIKPYILGSKATALYYLNHQILTPEALDLIYQALKINDNAPSARLLLGINAFNQTKYEEAIQHWQKIFNNPEADFDKTLIENAIQQAKEKQKIQ